MNTLYSILSEIGEKVSSAERAVTVFGRIMVKLEICYDESNEIIEDKELLNGEIAGPYFFSKDLKELEDLKKSEDLKKLKNFYKLSTEAYNKQMRRFVNREINDYSETDKDSNNNIRRIIAEKLACSINTNSKTIDIIEKLKKLFKACVEDKLISNLTTAFREEEYIFNEGNAEELRKYVLSLNAMREYILSFDDLYTKLAWIFLVSFFPHMPKNPKKDYLISIIYPALGLESANIDKKEDVESLNSYVSEERHEAERTSQTNISEYSKYINEMRLPSEMNKIENIFNFRSPKIKFQGRHDELEKLNSWLVKDGISVWALTGKGGSGKSRLALQFATQVEDDTKKECMGKAVWIDNEALDKLLTFNDFSYPKPVLFICDYAARYEEKLSYVVDKMSRTQVKAKFLLIERSDLWYSAYLEKSGIVNEFAVKEPIILDHLDFTPEEYEAIMQDFSDAFFGDGVKKITTEAQHQIIQKAEELSGKEYSARCLFLLLVTDAYLRDSDIQRLSAQNLFHNYLDHSRKILSKQYGEGTLEAGYRILAFATACGGILFSDIKNHTAIQNEWKIIKEHLKARSNINLFFQRISEIDESDTLAAMKPDLIGEYLFLHEWNDLMDEQKDWLFDLLKQDYSRSFFAMCLSDWKEESSTLFDLLFDRGADIEQKAACAVVFNRAVRESQSEEERIEYTAKIKELDHECSTAILKEYTSAIRFMFYNGTQSIISHCIYLLNEINWTHYSCESSEEQLFYAKACTNVSHIFYIANNNEKAFEYVDSALTIYEKVFSNEHLDTAVSYHNIAVAYLNIGDYEKAFDCVDNALTIYNKVYDNEPLDTTVIYNNIGISYSNIDDYEKGLEYLNKALAICERSLGKEHLDTAVIYNNIAKVNLRMCDYDKALEYSNKALAILEKELGTEHPDTSCSYNTIAQIYMEMCDYDKALEYSDKALAIREKKLGIGHQDTSHSYNTIAQIYMKMCDYHKALEYLNKALSSYKQWIGMLRSDRVIAAIYSNIAGVYSDMGDYENALEYFNKALTICEKTLGAEHPLTATIYRNIAVYYKDIGDYTKFWEYSRKANEVISDDK